MTESNKIRNLLKEGLFGFGQGPKMPQTGDVIKVDTKFGIKQMKVSGVEYDADKESIAIDGIVDGKPKYVYAHQIVESELREKEYKDNENDIVPGVLADGMSLQDLADKHSVELKYIKEQFDLGISIEMEHTNDYNLAKEIAKDHLFENPKYYDDLEEMEDDAEERMEEDLEHLEGISPEKWITELKKMDLGSLSPEDLEEITDQAGEVEQYLRRRADNATDVRTSRRYFNAVEWLEDNIF